MKTRGWIPIGAIVLAALSQAVLPAPLASQVLEEECAGADLFVTAREALLRQTPKSTGRVVGKLPAGTRLTLVAGGERFLQVEVPAPDDSGASAGYVARELTLVFPDGDMGSRDLVTVGRTLARTESLRRLGVALLLRASERLRSAGTPDPSVDVLLGEASEALAIVEGAEFPAAFGIAKRPEVPGGAFRRFYRGDAFLRALELTKGQTDPALAAIRERAAAGVLRCRYPTTSTTLSALWEETASWLQLAESASDPAALVSGAEHLGESSLALGRYLLATGGLDQLSNLESRVRAAGGRVASLLPSARPGKKLLGRASILRAMRGDGTRSFPQEARARRGAVERFARIEGKLGALSLTTYAVAGGTREPMRRTVAVPILPVPGSLRLSPDGKSAAWVEVAGPTTLLPVVVSLVRDEPAREIAFLSDGRPLRDRSLVHVVGAISAYSSDGSRLGLSIDAWNETPGPSPRYSVVSTATGELLFETSKDLKSFERLLQ